MDLRGNKITVGELMDYPPAREVLRRRYPMLLRRPPEGAGRTVTLEQVIALAGSAVSPRTVGEILRELESL